MDFSPIPGLLSLVDEAYTVPVEVDLSAAVRAASGSDHTTLRVSRTRWKAAALLVAAAAVLVIVGIVALSDDNTQPRQPRTELALTSGYGSTGFITVSARPWGTAIVFDLFDVPTRDGYTMWTVSNFGEWSIAANWAWSEEGTCGVPGATPLATGDNDRIVITGTGDKSDALVVGQPL